MAQVIELEDSIVKSVEVEVSGLGVALAIVSRMLNGSEIRRLKAIRHNNHTARMLTRGSLYTGTASGESVLLCTGNNYIPFLQILFNIAVSCFVSNGSDSTRLENVTVTKEGFGVSVSSRLIFTREVKVDIRALVALEAKEGFEGNIVAVTSHWSATLGAIFWRKVIA